ncbi:MAG: 5-dehydro-2-deoxygluconokinase [Alphaproteobacteria bacterium]|nr:5-dehydro-2-deoxygluconokinase [Alphaproteobacteria bacterium]
MARQEKERADGGDGKRLDLITIGRCSVDLYGQQIGGRLEDIASFAKSVGGCPANIAIGASRLGLSTGIVTRVGDEQMGRFVKEQMAREGVSLDGIVTDPAQLTALVLLAVESDRSFPLIFYRENCADAALTTDEIDDAFIARAGAILVTGTHFSKPHLAAAQRKAMALAKTHGGRIVLDIDYRPNLWGLAGHAAGEERYIRSELVSEHFKTILPECDLIVGTEEEIHIAAGEEDTLAALRAIRALSAATIVLKRGPMGCVVYPGAIPARIDEGIIGAGFPIEVYNVLGAGDAFLSGFLRGYLRDEELATCATWANACGAFAVSRLLCSPESPTWEELQHFLRHGSPQRALRKDETLNHIHWSTTRRPQAKRLMMLAADRLELEAVADGSGVPATRIGEFLRLAVAALGQVTGREAGCGVVLDDEIAREALFDAARLDLWIARPVALEIDPLAPRHQQDFGSRIIEWPVSHTVVTQLPRRAASPPTAWPLHLAQIGALFGAARKIGRELMIEIADDARAEELMAKLYDRGIRPDWWIIPQQDTGSLAKIGEAIMRGDPWCRGIAVRSPGMTRDSIVTAARLPLVRGLMAGFDALGDTPGKWLAGEISDAAATSEMAERFASLAAMWKKTDDSEGSSGVPR